MRPRPHCSLYLTMGEPLNKRSLMRSVGLFCHHIMDAVRSDSAARKKHVVNKKVEEIEKENLILRRTTIDEIEFKKREPSPSPYSHDHNSES